MPLVCTEYILVRTALYYGRTWYVQCMYYVCTGTELCFCFCALLYRTYTHRWTTAEMKKVIAMLHCAVGKDCAVGKLR